MNENELNDLDYLRTEFAKLAKDWPVQAKELSSFIKDGPDLERDLAAAIVILVTLELKKRELYLVRFNK